MVGGLTWAHAEDLVEVGADAHLLVELRRLGQVGAGFKVRHGEDVGPSLAGSCRWTSLKNNTVYYSIINKGFVNTLNTLLHIKIIQVTNNQTKNKTSQTTRIIQEILLALRCQLPVCE